MENTYSVADFSKVYSKPSRTTKTQYFLEIINSLEPSSVLLSRKALTNSFVNLSHLIFLECFLYFSPFPIPSFSLFLCSHQNSAASLECSVMNYSLSGPSTFVPSNTSIFSSFNLLHQSLFTTFIQLKNLSTISLEYGADKQSSIIRKM